MKQKIPKLGVALSLYDKVDCLETNVNIIRNHWKTNNDAFISVCCNDPNSLEKIEKFDIQKLTPGDEIPIHTKAHRRARIFDCITKSIMACKSDFIIHYHSDAYALSVEAIMKIIEQMENEEKHVAFRGRGLSYRTNKCINGDVDDHFIIFRRSEMMARNIFGGKEINKLEYLTAANPESLLSLFLQLSFDENELLFYSDMRENSVDPMVSADNFYSDGIMHRAMNPYNIDDTRGFVHIGDMTLVHDFLSERGVSKELIKVREHKEEQSPENLNSTPDYLQEWLNE